MSIVPYGLEHLPFEIKLMILDQLSLQDIENVGMVSKVWYKTVTEYYQRGWGACAKITKEKQEFNAIFENFLHLPGSIQLVRAQVRIKNLQDKVNQVSIRLFVRQGFYPVYARMAKIICETIDLHYEDPTFRVNIFDNLYTNVPHASHHRRMMEIFEDIREDYDYEKIDFKSISTSPKEEEVEAYSKYLADALYQRVFDDQLKSDKKSEFMRVKCEIQSLIEFLFSKKFKSSNPALFDILYRVILKFRFAAFPYVRESELRNYLQNIFPEHKNTLEHMKHAVQEHSQAYFFDCGLYHIERWLDCLTPKMYKHYEELIFEMLMKQSVVKDLFYHLPNIDLCLRLYKETHQRDAWKFLLSHAPEHPEVQELRRHRFSRIIRRFKSFINSSEKI